MDNGLTTCKGCGSGFIAHSKMSVYCGTKCSLYHIQKNGKARRLAEKRRNNRINRCPESELECSY